MSRRDGRGGATGPRRGKPARRAGIAIAAAILTCGPALGTARAADSAPSQSAARDGSAPLDDASASKEVEAFYGFDAASPRVREWQPFLAALARNPLMRRVLDDEAARPSSTAQRARVRRDANGAVVQIVVEGLRRVDDADLLAARPLIVKFIAGGMSACREAGPDGVARRPRVQIEEELGGLVPVLTRAVAAVDAAVPIVAVDPVALADANRRAFAVDASTAAPSTASSGRSAPLQAIEASPECDRAAAAIRFRLQGPAIDAPVVVRSVLAGYARGMTGPHVYAAGDPPAYPAEALRASVVGSQIVRFTVDASSRLKSTQFVKSAFVPATVVRPDGTVVPSSDLFDAEVRAWLAATSATTPPRFPARANDGALADTAYELPFQWAVDDASATD